jgi:ATP-binding cassette, subfamily B, bacterial MsbA
MITRQEILLFIHYLRPYKIRIGQISALAVICAFFEAVNLSALVPLLQILNNPTDPGGMLWDALKSIFGVIHVELNFLNLLIVMGIIFLVGQVLLFIKKRKQADLWFSFSADLKKTIFRNLLSSDIRYHYTEKPGKFIDILNRQAEYAATSVFAVTEIFTFVFFIIVYTAILLYISIPLTAICLIIALGSLFFLNFLIRRSKQIGIRSNETNIRMNEFVTERLNLLKLIKIFSTENEETQKLSQYADQYTKNNTDFWMNGVKIETTFQIIIFGISLLILYVAAIVLVLPLALLLVFIFILIRLTDPIRQINAKRHELGGELASLEKIDHTLKATTSSQTIKSGQRAFETIHHEMEIDHVTFSYTESVPVIRDLSFTIRKNEMVALVGASGGGKSTIVDLIIRLIEPDSGRILIDGIDIQTYNIRDYHRKIGFVSQESYIFNDTILNNITYGVDQVLLDKVIEAAKSANAHDFIMQLPDGYNSELGERGVKISGGQKQRIALARALYRDPEILILDEATSALDSEAEKAIQKSILSLKNKYTIIAIAHRLSTIENSDKILVIENGQITETGTHKELISAKGTYAKYYDIQYNSVSRTNQSENDN